MNIDNTSAARFAELVEDCGLSGKIHDYHFLSGLLLALASVPVVIPPSEWLSFIFVEEDKGPVFPSVESCQSLLGELMPLWNYWTDAIAQDGLLPLPSEYHLENGIASTELARFCTGIISGYGRFLEEWETLFDTLAEPDGIDEIEEIKGTFGAVLASSLQLADPETARLLQESNGTEPLDPDVALEILHEGLTFFGKLGTSMSVDDMDIDTTPSINPLRDIGRNDPCPCGSGKKYKKCCLV